MAASADLPIGLHVSGDLAALPAAIELSAFRVVQEALTNIRRHAGPVRRVEVRLEHVDGALTVLIDDDGRGASAASGEGQGYGAARHARASRRLRWSPRCGPRAGGGWRVRAVFPVQAVAA
ncbi:MAG: hypothetical protein R2713_15195 [Ilumatobacteraceae bacterium]